MKEIILTSSEGALALSPGLRKVFVAGVGGQEGIYIQRAKTQLLLISGINAFLLLTVILSCAPHLKPAQSINGGVGGIGNFSLCSSVLTP